MRKLRVRFYWCSWWPQLTEVNRSRNTEALNCQWVEITSHYLQRCHSATVPQCQGGIWLRPVKNASLLARRGTMREECQMVLILTHHTSRRMLMFWEMSRLPCPVYCWLSWSPNLMFFPLSKKNNLSKKSNVDKRSNVLLTAKYSLPEGWQRGKTESVRDFTCGAGDRIIQLASNQ